MGGGVGGLGEKTEGIKKYKLAVTSHGDVKHSIGNIVNNIIITTYRVRWVQDLLGDHFCRLYKCLNTILYT